MFNYVITMTVVKGNRTMSSNEMEDDDDDDDEDGPKEKGGKRDDGNDDGKSGKKKEAGGGKREKGGKGNGSKEKGSKDNVRKEGKGDSDKESATTGSLEKGNISMQQLFCSKMVIRICQKQRKATRSSETTKRRTDQVHLYRSNNKNFPKIILHFRPRLPAPALLSFLLLL